MKTRNPAKVILENMVGDENARRAPQLDIHKFFEFFAASQILKDHNLNDDELLSGIPESDRFRDGGIDGIYLFLNHRFVQVGTDPDLERPISELQIYIIQCKYTENLPEEIIHKFIVSMQDLLDITQDIDNPVMRERYAPEIIETVETFRKLYRNSRSGVKISFNFYVAHLAPDVPPHLAGKANLLYKAVTENVVEAKVSLDFLGPQNLVLLVRREPKMEFPLEYKRDVISPDERGFTCLVNLFEYYKFIHDNESNTIRESIFEANVRDYQGENLVNNAIANSLGKTEHNIDFWWLNNGVTMVAEKVTRRGDGLIIENPEIVNGLQTSYAVHHYFTSSQAKSDTRHILVRVIELGESDEETRDLIIRATNSQTPIAPLLLHATETIHSNVEYYLKKCSPPIYYERRKNYYRNKGKKISEIMDIQTLAQSIVAILLRHPDDARARIRAFLSGKEKGSDKQIQRDNYSLVFDPSYSYDFYYICSFIRKRTEAFLKSDEFSVEADRKSRAKYVLHHIMMDLVIILTRNSEGPLMDTENPLADYADQISRIKPGQITNEYLNDSANCVMRIFENEHYKALPNSAKGGDMVKEIILEAKQRLKELR